jgi:hypothetical protein
MTASRAAVELFVRRILALVAVAATGTGCAARHIGRTPAQEPVSVIVTFDSARPIVMLGRKASGDAMRQTRADVLELGGRVTGYRGDTLLLRPDYITAFVRISERETRIVRRSASGVAELVLVPLGRGVQETQAPTRGRSFPANMVLLLVGASAAATVLGYAFTHHHD